MIRLASTIVIFIILLGCAAIYKIDRMAYAMAHLDASVADLPNKIKVEIQTINKELKDSLGQ